MGCAESKPELPVTSIHFQQAPETPHSVSGPGVAVLLTHSAPERQHLSAGSHAQAQEEVEHLRSALLRLGLQVHAHSDLTAQQVVKLMEQYAATEAHGPMLLVVTGWTTGTGGLMAAGGSSYQPSTLWRPFLRTHRAPRIIVLNTWCTVAAAPACCALLESSGLPHAPDYLVACSARRHEPLLADLSYLTLLADELNMRAHRETITELLTRVHRRVSSASSPDRTSVAFVSFLQEPVRLGSVGPVVNRVSSPDPTSPGDFKAPVIKELPTGMEEGYSVEGWGRCLIFYVEEQRSWARRLRTSLQSLAFETRLVPIKGGNVVPVLADEAQGEGLQGCAVLLVAVVGPISLTNGPRLLAGGHSLPLSHACRPFVTSRCPALRGRPRIFLFLDPCGQTLQTAQRVPPARKQEEENYTDFLFVYGFTPGFLEALCRGLGSLGSPREGLTPRAVELVAAVTRALGHSGEPSALAARRYLSHLSSYLTAPLQLAAAWLAPDQIDSTVPPETSLGRPSICEAPRGSIVVLAPRGSIARPVTWPLRCRTPAPNFQGRGLQLEQVRRQLGSEGVRQHLIDVAVTGSPGVGKSELVLQALLQPLGGLTDHVVWLPAHSSHALREAFIMAARVLGVPDTKEDTKLSTAEVAARLYAHLSPREACSVFVLTDVRDYSAVEELLPFYLPLDRRSLRFVVTSQHRRWRCDLHVPLEPFSAQEGEEFLLENLGFVVEGKALLLARMLGCHPLVFQLAVAYIQQQHRRHNLRMAEFFSKYALVDKSIGELKGAMKHSDSTPLAIIWLLGIESVCAEVEGKLAVRVLDLCAFLDSGIVPPELFASLRAAVGSANLQAAVQLLARHGLVSPQAGESFSVHRMVQEVTRRHMIRKSLVVRQVLQLLQDNLSQSKGCLEDYPLHGVAAWRHASKYTELVKQFAPVLLALLRCERLAPESRVELLEESSPVLERVLGWSSELFLRLQGLQVELLWRCDLADRCVAVGRRLLQNVPERSRRTRATLQAVYTQGRALHRLGRLEEAWQLYSGLHEDRRAALGVADPDTVHTLSGMCSTAAEIESSGDPRPLEVCVALLEQAASDLRVDMDGVLVQVASISWRLSWDFRWTEGLALFDRLYSRVSELLGPSHPRARLALLAKAELLHFMDRGKDAALLLHTLQLLQGDEPGTIVGPEELAADRRALKACLQRVEEAIRGDMTS